MKRSVLRIFSIFLCLCLLCPTFLATNVKAEISYRRPPAKVENDPNDPNAAQNITNIALIKDHGGFFNLKYLFNGLEYGKETTQEDAFFTVEYETGIGYLYLIFNQKYGTYTVTNNDTGAVVTLGQNGFLHDLIDLAAHFGSAPTSVTVHFISGPAQFSELLVFTPGYLPEYVQVWEPAKENQTDLILFSTHGDDDTLFFAGILPYYCALDYEVLVV